MTRMFVLLFFVFIQLIQCSFWNEIPQRCIYDRTTLLSCWNTTFTQPIPLFNDLSYTLQNHRVQIRDSILSLSLNELLLKVAPNIGHMILVNNKFVSLSTNKTIKLYFRVLQTLEIHDKQALEWYQLNTSYFPQLIQLDLSENEFTSKNSLKFFRDNFPTLKSLNLSHNHLQTLENLIGNIFHRIEYLDLSFNPLETIEHRILEFSSLIYLDLSATLIKQLFSSNSLIHLETLILRQCSQISMNEYEKTFENCSQIINLDLSQTTIASIKHFQSCIKSLILTNLSTIKSLSSDEFSLSTNLETIQMNFLNQIKSIPLHIYDRLKSIDLSSNSNLENVIFYLQSDYIYLERLILSHTSMNNFMINFTRTKLDYLHIDFIDLSDNHLETIDFLRYLTFFSLDLSSNYLKIIDMNSIDFHHGMYELSFMNILNISSNNLEFIHLNWNNESPHTIDLSNNSLQIVKLTGQTTYTLVLNQNSNLSLIPSNFSLDLPLLQNIYLNSIKFLSFDYLIYLYNLTNLRTLFLNHNQLEHNSRTLNWNIFYPWHRNLTHLSLQNMSIESIDRRIYLHDYSHLLTINLYDNSLVCNCILHPFIVWLKSAPLNPSDFNEPLHKELNLDCPLSIFYDQCKESSMKSIIIFIVLGFIGVSLIVSFFLIKTCCWLRQRRSSKSYDRMLIDDDVIALNETSISSKKTDDE